MNNFLEKILQLGAELEKENNILTINMILNDAELLYDKHIKEQTNEKREKIDFTDKELHYVALAFQSFINDRDTYISKSGAIVINKTMQKIIDNGFTRKNSETILHPIVNFNTEE